MNTSEDKISNKKATDPFDRLIFEKGLRIKRLIIDKELDLIILILNNGKLIKSHISYYSKLKKASQKELESWRLIGGGVGIHWESLDEDLSVKGFIKNSALNTALYNLQNMDRDERIIV
ncbi:MAG: DUF2442 domain-containing protein [Bacteroidetes bacterium]|nr:DUF2442 domain-containing protein [Bacteroidota bacterium]